MNFPDYVPDAVRAHISILLDGDDHEPFGWVASLASAEKQLVDIEEWIRVRTLRGEVDVLDALRKEKAEAVKHRDGLANNVECLRRLATDLRMREAYSIIAKELQSDEHQRGFIYAAWAARMDFFPFRERIKKAESLKNEIAETAQNLARMIRDYSKLGMYGPDEFYSIPHLLRETDNHEMQGHDLHMWRAMRGYVLGDTPEHEKPKHDGDMSGPMEIKIVFLEPGEKAEIDPKEEARNTLRYAWEKAPSFDALLDTLAKAALDFTPSEHGMIGAAISKRQHNERAEYLRAFAKLLNDVHHITITPALMRAMAIVGNVALDLQDDLLSYDDVRKTLA